MRFSLTLPACLLLSSPILAQHMQFTGDSAGDVFGISVSDVNDVNADGIRDFVIGAYLDDPSGSSSGSARVHSGTDGALLYNFLGEAPGDQLGISVAGAGDVNADGYGDILVGAWLADFGGADAGRAYVFSGFDGATLFVFDGDSAGEHFGEVVAGGVDLNGDGHDDLLIGAPNDANNGAGAGSVRVLSGFDGTVLHSIDGDSAGDEFGTAIAGLGDIDGDTVDDFVVGAPYDDDAGADSGRVRAYSGATGSVLHVFDGTAMGDELGISVGSLPDINADGRAEVITSAWKCDANGTDSGRVQVRSGADGAVLHTFDGGMPGDGLGRGGAVGVGDVDGDGVADLLVGTPFSDEGGMSSGSAIVYSGFDGARMFTFEGSIPGDWLGYSVSSAGDVNGDGLIDLLVGAPLDDDNGNLSGSAFVYLGHCWMVNYCESTPNSSGGPATITALGSLSILANDMVLRAQPCPKHQFGVFFYGPTQTHIPFGQGYLCVGGGGVGLQRFTPIVQVNNQKIADYNVDFTQPPANGGPGQIIPGSTWNFQFWFRDPPAGAPSFNLTDGLAITFCN